MSYDENGFQVRLGKSRKRGGVRSAGSRHLTLVGQIQAAAGRNGSSSYRLSGSGRASGRFNARGRGASVAAGFKGQSSWSQAGGIRSRSRRVAVKARVVKLNPQRGASRGRMFATPKAVASHLDYLQRDGVTRDGERGQLYSGDQDVANGAAFLERGGNDRHQFRFIVSPEDGAELSSLKETTRDLMRQMEADLQTQLDWVAVNHYNTEHPHSHVLLRGVTDDGKTLNISGDYIAYGVRERASEIVTRELGRQTEYDISRQLNNEVDADRFTRLDRLLIAEQQKSNEFADLRPDQDMNEMFRINRAAMIGRARKLERMGLATEGETGQWSISPDAELTLRELGERGDIIKGIHKTLAREGMADARHHAHHVIHGEDINERVVGRVLSKDLAGDELGDRMRLAVDGVDGHIHSVVLSASKAEDVRRGSIVEIVPAPSGPRASDRNIMSMTDEQGIYQPSRHIELARNNVERVGGDPVAFITSHIRRLEALRRAGHVERIDEDHWRIPNDLTERGASYDRAREGSGIRANTLSDMSLKEQVGHDGKTWLDRELAAQDRTPLSPFGFGRDVSQALNDRKQELTERELMQPTRSRTIDMPRTTANKPSPRDIEKAGRALAAENGREWHAPIPGNYVSGRLTGSTMIGSQRFAMMDTIGEDGRFGLSLVPWKKDLQHELGNHITGVAMPGGGVEWSLGRGRGLGR